MIEVDERKIYADAEIARRLLDNDDFNIFLSRFDEEYKKLWDQLKITPTTDPVIAQIQGELKRLESIVGRVYLWFDRAAVINKNRLDETINSKNEDY